MHGGFPFDELPLEVDLGGAFVNVSHDASDEQLDLTVDLSVNPSTLRVETNSGTRDSAIDTQIPMVAVPEIGEASLFAGRVADAVAFISRNPLALSRKSVSPELVPENEHDLTVLAALGTREVLTRLSGTTGVTMRLPLVSTNVSILCQRPSAIRLYGDALKMGTSTGRVREMWRVLEAAFGAKGQELVDLLSRCEAAQDMEFTKQELQDLHTLRGRASHASSRADFDEVASVERESAKVVARLQGLAEALIVRKADWGSRTVAVDPSSPRYPYVRRDGSIVIHQSTEIADDNG